MARNYDATPLSPIPVGCAPTCPSGPGRPGAIAPIVSVSSVNGENGDVVLKDLIIGDKTYNGSNEIEIFASDLGLGKAVVFIKTLGTKAKVEEALADSKAGDLYFCNEDGYFYLSVGEGDSKQFASNITLADYSKIVNTASKIALEVDNDTFKMVAKLYDLNGNIIFVSDPIVIPTSFDDVITRGYFDTATGEIVFVLKNGKEVRVPLGGLVESFQPRITETNKLAMNLVEGLAEFKVATEQGIAAERAARIDAVAQEAVARTNADNTEKQERITVDQSLQDQITAEKTAREAKDTEIEQNLNTEIQQRKDSFDLLKTKIYEEAEERVKVDAKVIQEIADRKVADTNLQTQISNETTERETADNTLRDDLTAEINTRVTQVLELRNSLANETSARTIRDAELADLIDDEKAARESNDELLAAQIQKEVQDRTQADDTERAARIAEDTRIEAKLDKEIADRNQGDADLLTALRNEINTREYNDTAILTELRAEEAARADADTTLQSNIDIETGARTQADAVLQEEIDNIPVYGMIKDADPGNYAAVYHLTKQIKDGEVVTVGTPINIAKDFLVKSASVRKVTSETDPAHTQGGIPVGHTCIDFIINVKAGTSEESHIYVDVTTLIDIYTAGNGIAISDDRIISINEATFNRLHVLETGLAAETANRVSADDLLADSISSVNSSLLTHIADKANPHAVTKAQVGLGNADNTSDINKPVSTAQQEAINSKAAEIRTELNTVKTSLETSITNEVTARTNADTALGTRIDNEATARTNADTTLQTNIDNEATARNAAIVTEATARDAEDQELWAAINALENKITAVAKELTCNGTDTEYTITHNLDTYNVLVQVYEMDAPKSEVVVDNARISANTIKLTFKVAPAENKQYMVMCYGIPMSYALTFMPNGGSGTMAGVNVIKGVPHTMEACTFTAPENQQFDKWAIGSAEGTKVAAGETYTFNADTDVYATWKSSEPNFYYGTVDTIPPTSITGMTGEYTTRETLLTNGYEKTIPVAEEQEAYEAIAFATSLNLSILKVENFVFGAWQDVTEDFDVNILGSFTVCYHKNLVIGPTEEQYRFTFIAN